MKVNERMQYVAANNIRDGIWEKKLPYVNLMLLETNWKQNYIITIIGKRIWRSGIV